jgi:hypothetical protein
MKSWSFWAFALVPWLLEILFGTHVFNTLLGSTLWTLILLLALIRHQVRDPRLRTGLMRGKWVVISAWLVIWFLSFLENPHPSLGATVPNLESKFWIQLHVALLTARPADGRFGGHVYASGFVLFMVFAGKPPALGILGASRPRFPAPVIRKPFSRKSPFRTPGFGILDLGIFFGDRDFALQFQNSRGLKPLCDSDG